MVTTASKLEFVLKPLADRARLTTCDFAITIDGETVWPVRGEAKIFLEIQIDDLFAYLTEFWKPLMLRQVYPIPVEPSRPSDLRRAAEGRWADQQASTVEREENIVSTFEEAHDLSHAFGGLFDLPHFWMMRSGDEMVVESAHRVWHLPFEEVRESLRAVGDEISGRLSIADAKRWSAAIEAWNDRDRSDGAGLLAWSTGLDKKLAKLLIDAGDLAAPEDFDDAANDNDELRIAARMAGALPAEQIRTVLAAARQFEKHDSPQLRELAKECSDHIVRQFARKKPFEQGEAAAIFAREKLGVPNDGPADIFEIMRKIGVTVRSSAVDPSTFDGLAIWGNRYGPGVFLNEGSVRIDDRFKGDIEDHFAARGTLAHELCHLLLDGGHALSAVEVMDARMPVGIEARAGSFAGEFLLPTQAAARVWDRAERPTDRRSLERLVEELSRTYSVTWSVAAWKLQHGAATLNGDLERVLNIVAPRR